MLEIADDVADVCPDAVLLNYTNPMAMLMWALTEASHHARLVGLCHSVQNTHAELARIVGVRAEEIDFLTAGVNHQAFVLRFERDGESLYPLLDEAIQRDPTGAGTPGARRALPAVRALSDRVQRAQCRVRAPVHAPRQPAVALPHTLDEYVRRSCDNLDEYRETQRRLDAGEPLPPKRAGELAPRYIHALVTGEPRIEYGNVSNGGLIDNLRGGACVEVPCRVDRDGVHPIPVG